ncbi:DUF5723 family protein [Bacteroidota bacterium]
MNLKGFLTITLLLFFTPQISFSQGFPGIRTSNFNGLENIILNPASAVNLKTYCNINILSSSIHFNNNFLYIPKEDFSFFQYLAGNFNRYNSSSVFPEGKPFLDKTVNKTPLVFGQAYIMGPSVQFSIKRHSFTAFSAVKGAVYSDLPYNLLKFAVEGTEYNALYGGGKVFPDFNSGALMWSEIGLGYGRLIETARNINWQVGMNVKLLAGQYGAFYENYESNYSIDSTAFLLASNIDMMYGYTPNPKMTYPYGYGLGFDFGVQYIQRYHGRPAEYYTSLSNQTFNDYLFKIGLSLVDVGGINFQYGTSLFKIKSDSTFTVDDFREFQYYSLDSLNYYLYDKIVGSIPENYNNGNFRYSLPTRLSLQLDYHIYKQFYINAVLTTGLYTKNSHINTPTQLSFCPRYETKDLEIWLPTTINSYSNFQIGIAVRYKYLIIGTEKIVDYLGMYNFKGWNFFMSLSIPFVIDQFQDQRSKIPRF